MPKMLMNFTTNTENISSHVKYFSRQFKIGTILQSCEARKQKGIEVMKVFYYLCSLLLCDITMNRDQRTRNHGNLVRKDTCHRFLQSISTDWNKFQALLANAIIRKDFIPLRRKDCEGKDKPFFLIADDSSYYRNRSKKVELFARNWDHALGRHYKGFRMLTLAWTDGISVLPVAFCNMSTCNTKNRLNEAKVFCDKKQDSFGCRIRRLAQQKMNDTLLDLIDVATAAKIQAKYVLCDKWFSSPATIFSILSTGYEVICMLKNSSTYYIHEGNRCTLKQIFRILVNADRIQRKLDRKAGKKKGKPKKFLFTTIISLVNKKDGTTKEVKLVFVRNRNKKSEFLSILCTDTALTEDQIIEYYGCRWGIELLFHTCKSFLRLQKSTQSLDYSEIHASTAIIMFQYSMLSWMNRNNSDEISFGELFHQLLEEVQDVALFNAIGLILSMFIETIASEYSLPLEKLNETLNKFLRQLPLTLKNHFESVA